MELVDFCKTDIRFMNQNELKAFLLDIEAENVVLILSKSASQRLQWHDYIETMQKRYHLLWIDENVTYPTQKTILMGLNKLKNFQTEIIIAVGGGSVIDFAKALKAFAGRKEITSADQITNILEAGNVLPDTALQVIAVPTTAGTGAELTKWATIWDDRKQRKYSIDDASLKPDVAVIVPELTMSAPIQLTLSTALDALAHAIEAYWSKKSNFLVRELAKNSIRLIVEYLPLLLKDPCNLSYREKQSIASVLAGLAFSITRTTACHSISYPLTMDYGIPHGIAVAMTLPGITAKNHGTYAQEEELSALFDGVNGLNAFIQQLCLGKVSLSLHDYGVNAYDIGKIVKKSFTLGRMNNNPVELSEEDITECLQNILEKE